MVHIPCIRRTLLVQRYYGKSLYVYILSKGKSYNVMNVIRLKIRLKVKERYIK